MTKNKLPIVLAIAPGTREFGVAVFREFELVYFAVKRLKHGTISKHLKSEVIALWRELFESYSPKVLAFKRINQYQQTSQTLLLIAECLKKQAADRQIKTVEISLAQIRLLLGSSHRKPTQKLIFQRITALYPELEQYRNRPSRGQENYYAYILSAVAVGLVCLNDLSHRTAKDNL